MKLLSRTFKVLISSLKPSLSLGISCGPLSFFTEPPGVLSPDLSSFASATGLLLFSFEAPFMMEPMLGIVLACETPLVWDGVVVWVSGAGAAAPGVGVLEWWFNCDCCCC